MHAIAKKKLCVQKSNIGVANTLINANRERERERERGRGGRKKTEGDAKKSAYCFVLINILTCLRAALFHKGGRLDSDESF